MCNTGTTLTLSELKELARNTWFGAACSWECDCTRESRSFAVVLSNNTMLGNEITHWSDTLKEDYPDSIKGTVYDGRNYYLHNGEGTLLHVGGFVRG